MNKQLLFLFICTTAGMGAILFYLWQQVTYLPSWYTRSSPVATTPTSQTKPQLPQRQVSDYLTQLGKTGEVQLSSQEVDALVAASVAQSHDKKGLAQAIVDTNTEIQDGKISIGAVVDLKAIPTEEVLTQKQATLIQMLNTVPIVGNRHLYVGIEGKPSLQNQQVILDEATRIKLGHLSFTFAELSQRLGIPQESLQQQISQGLQNLPVEVEGVEVVGDRLVIRSSEISQ